MMGKYRTELPQLSGDLFLTDAGLETDLIFNQGIEIREFAAHTLLSERKGREALLNYFRGFLNLANDNDAGFILDSQTWKAHSHWATDLGANEDELRKANFDAIDFIADIRDEYSSNGKPIVLNGLIGPRGDAYAPDTLLAAEASEKYHSKQIEWLAGTQVDMVTALTFTQSSEAIGVVRAAQKFGLPIVVSFTVETDGKLPTGQTLAEAITTVDSGTNSGASYFMVNCAHPDHFIEDLTNEDWARRIKGLRCNASRMSHAELDECEVLDDGNPIELASEYKDISLKMPWLNIFGGCCGSDLRHVTEIAKTFRRGSQH